MWPVILFILVFLTIADSFAEGSVDAWAALYMRDHILVTGFVIGLATISFNIFMVVGRLIGDQVRDLLGVFQFILLLLVFCICGLIIIFYFNSITTSIIGFSLLGLGISNIIPLAYSISGKIDNIDSAVSISIISIAAYGVFMVGPALMGLIANYFGISYVFLPLIFLFSLCLIVVFSAKKLLT